MLAQHHRVDEGGRALVHRILVQIDVLDAVALGNRAGELRRGHHPAFEQGLTGRATGLARLHNGALNRLTRGEVVLDDDVADPA